MNAVAREISSLTAASMVGDGVFYAMGGLNAVLDRTFVIFNWGVWRIIAVYGEKSKTGRISVFGCGKCEKCLAFYFMQSGFSNDNYWS